MSLDHTRRVFERLGREDPLYTAIARRGYEGNRWDPEAFFAYGRERVAEVLGHVAEVGLEPRPERALDFGCGAGRLTQALADHFETVTGVDISASMIERARTYNRHGERVRYVLNTSDRLPLEDARIDFLYSTKTLQHIPPQHARRYVREFMRVLAPDGVAVFQFRNGPDIEPGTLRGWLYHLRRHHLRRIVRRLRGRPPYEMHVLNRDRVAGIVGEGGGRVVDVRDLSRERPNKSLRFVVAK